MMHRLQVDFDEPKISAFSKVKKIQPYIHNVTIGPEKSDVLTGGFSNSFIDTHDSRVKNDKNDDKMQKPPQYKHKSILLQRAIQNLEDQRYAEVTAKVNARAQLFQDFSKNQQKQFQSNWLKKQQELIVKTQKQEQFIIQTLQKFDQAAEAHHQLILQHQKQAEQRQRKNLELQAQEEQKIRFKYIAEKLNVYEKEIVPLINSSKNPEELQRRLGNGASILKSFSEKVLAILDQCKVGQINDQDYQQFVVICNEFGTFKELIQKKIDEIQRDEIEKEIQLQQIKELEEKSKAIALQKQQEQQRLQQEQQLRQQQEQQLLRQQTEAQISNVQEIQTQINKYVSVGSLKLCQEIQDFAKEYENNYQEIIKNPQLKKFRFNLNKSVSIPVNALAQHSRETLLDKYDRLSKLLSGKTVDISDDNQVKATEHPQGIAYCTNLLAKMFVLQGEITISSKPELAFSYAAIIVALWTSFPNFGTLTLAHFYKQCPYLIPFYHPRTVDQTDEDFYTSQGYKYTDGVVEDNDLFLKRMTGFVRLYAAIIITKLKMGLSGPHPHGLNMGWRWLAAILNLEPRPYITATVLFTFLESAGSTLQETYGKQFNKIILFIIKEYMDKLKKIDTGGPVTRLEALLQYVQKTGRIERPKGILPPRFW